jgi:hypothetical protein
MFRMNRTLIASALSLVAMSVIAAPAECHEGHGHPDHQHGASHYVVNPSHAMPILAGVSMMVFGGLALRQVLRSRGEK